MIQIETGVPIPKQDCRTMYCFADLDIEGSFFAPAGNENSIRAAACMHGKRNGKRFKVRKVQGGIRVWRTK